MPRKRQEQQSKIPNTEGVARPLPHTERQQGYFRPPPPPPRFEPVAGIGYHLGFFVLHLLPLPFTARVLGWQHTAQELGWQPAPVLYHLASSGGVVVASCEHLFPIYERVLGHESAASFIIDAVYKPALGCTLLTLLITLAIAWRTAKLHWLRRRALVVVGVYLSLPAVVGIRPPTDAATLRTLGTPFSPWSAPLLSTVHFHALSKVLGIVTVLLIFEAAMSGRRKKVDQGPRYKAVEQFDQVAASYLSRDRQLT